MSHLDAHNPINRRKHETESRNSDRLPIVNGANVLHSCKNITVTPSRHLVREHVSGDAVDKYVLHPLISRTGKAHGNLRHKNCK